MDFKLLINDIRRQNEANRTDIDAAFRRVLDRGWYISGPEVEAFEAEFARYCGAAHCVGVGNGTDALELAVRAAGVQPGDRVATVANAGMYGATAILRSEAKPVFVDVRPDTMLMTSEGLAGAPGVKAAIVTHLYGRMAEMPSLVASGVPLIEDCAQAHGARLNGRAAGTWGVAGCFSFYPTKNLGALGDAGAVVTNDPTMAARLRSLRQYGWTAKYVSGISGGRNSRLDELQAAILRVKLPHVDKWNERRRAIAARYDAAFGVNRTRGSDDVAHLYVLRCANRESVMKRLADAGIATAIHYPVPDHQQESVRMKADLPVTEALCDQVLTLPLFPDMTDEEIEAVVRITVETRRVTSGS